MVPASLKAANREEANGKDAVEQGAAEAVVEENSSNRRKKKVHFQEGHSQFEDWS